MKYTPDNTTIAVIGGGNIGTQFACICASKNYSVNIFSSKPELYDRTLEVVDEFGKTTLGTPSIITSNIKEAVEGCRIIFVTHPAFNLKNIADKLLPYIKDDVDICILPGTGGAEFSFRMCIRAGATLFGLQRVPSVARLEQYGKRVRCEGQRPRLFLASSKKNKANDFADFISSLFDIPCIVLPNYLCVTLTPSNQILHTTRLRTLFSDYEKGKTYESNPLFYGDWNDESSELLIACDNELQDMLKIMDRLNLNSVQSLKIHYACNSAEDMTRKIRSIKSLHNLPSPMKKGTGGWVPDFTTRFFSADFPYGLAILEEFATVLEYNAHNINETMDWYRRVTGNMEHLYLGDYDIHCLEDIYRLYQE